MSWRRAKGVFIHIISDLDVEPKQIFQHPNDLMLSVVFSISPFFVADYLISLGLERPRCCQKRGVFRKG